MEVECVYENGVLRPLSKLDLKEEEKVRVEIKESIAERTKGIIKDSEIEKIIEEIENGVFCDSNVILYHLADKSSSATNLIKRIEKGDMVGYINDIVISEVTYGYIRAKTKFKPFELKRKIKSVKLGFSAYKGYF